MYPQILKKKGASMNTVLLDVLTDTKLRDIDILEASATENVSAGLPWLSVE